MARYFLNILIALDQLGTTLLGGWPDETLSSYAHRMWVQDKPWGFMRGFINALFFWQRDHCRVAYEDELALRQLPPMLRR